MNKEVSRFNLFNLFILILTIYVLLALLIDTFFNIDEEISKILKLFDFIICLIFLSEFFYKLYTAKNRLEYLKWGWVDFLSSIPMLEGLRYGRILRLIRLVRILRAFRSVQELMNMVYKDKAKGSLISALTLAFFILLFSSITILLFETDPTSNIKNAEDAIWWSYTTITTVGYGDRYPVTLPGRILAIFLMTYGISVFGILTAFLASKFVK